MPARWIHPWGDLSKVSGSHPRSAPPPLPKLYLSSTFLPIAPLILFFSSLPPSLSFIPLSALPLLPLIFPPTIYIFFRPLLPSFPFDYYLLSLACPPHVFFPFLPPSLFSVAFCFLSRSPFPSPVFVLPFSYCYFYVITHPLLSPLSLPDPLSPSLHPSLPLFLRAGCAARVPEWQGDIVCHISIPRQSPFSPESNYFFQSERFNLL